MKTIEIFHHTHINSVDTIGLNDIVGEMIQQRVCDADYCIEHRWARRWREDISIADAEKFTLLP